MNSSPYPRAGSAPPDHRGSEMEIADAATLPVGYSETGLAYPRLKRGSSWIVSLTAVCFLFGGLLAMQLRAVEKVRKNQEDRNKGVVQAQQQVKTMQRRFQKEKDERAALQSHLQQLQAALAKGELGSKDQARQLNAQIKELQLVSGLTSVSGPGVSVSLNDNPNAAKTGGGSPFLPGIVHDYDLLQVVNELRAAKAEAIAVNGRRVTGFTPIRCVGPTILINWEAAAPPFHIEAIGDPKTLKTALTMPGGILDNLQNTSVGPGLGVEVRSTQDLHLPATEAVPHLRLARSPQEEAPAQGAAGPR